MMNFSFNNGKNRNFFALNLLATYIIVLSFRGFLFASNDVVDVMSYAKFLNDPTLFPHDFYIQHIAGSIPNERIIFAGFLSMFGDSISWASLLLHAIFSMIMFGGIYQIASIFIDREFLKWLVVLTLCIPLYGIGVGDCELYYNMFIASLMAKSIGVWAIYYWIANKSNLAWLWLIPVTWIHPTVGAQLFLIFIAFGIMDWMMTGKIRFLYGFLISLLVNSIYIILLQYQLNQGEVISRELFFEIFEFRLAHHFFPEYFGWKNWIISAFLIGLALYYFNRIHNIKVTAFLLITITGMVVYSLAMLYYPIEIIMTSQWFKSYIWVEMLGVIALFALAEKWIRAIPALPGLCSYFTGFYMVTALVLFILVHLPGNYFSQKKHEFFYIHPQTKEAAIAKMAKENTPENAVFIVPMDFTEFKYYSERSLFIDYKSVVHRKNALGEWYRRIQMIYGIDLQDRLSGTDLYEKGRQNFRNLSLDAIRKLKENGVTFLVSYADIILPLNQIAANDSYIIYSLEKIPDSSKQ